MKTILAIPSEFGASGHWRMIEPLRHWRGESALRFTLYAPNTTFTLAGYDAMFVQRPGDTMRAKLVKRCKELGKKVCIDIDDRLPIVDPAHECFQTHGERSELWSIMRECITLADGLIVSTPELAAFYRPLNPRILVAGNAVDLKLPIYRARMTRPAPLAGKTVMFWSGQIWGHAANLRIIKNAVEQAISQTPDLVLVICAPRQLLDVFSLPADRVFHVEPMPFEQFMRVASIADFSLAPLELNEFNDCKSEIRILESAAWGVPCIASPAAPYRRFHERSDGACLLAQANDHQAWLNPVLHLAGDAQQRREIGARTRMAVELQYDLKAENLKRESFITSLWE